MSTILDPFGTALLAIRASADVVAIVGDADEKVTSQAKTPPFVRLRAGPVSLAPFGPGSASIGVQLWTGIAQCYGPDDETGEMLASRLARAVAASLHGLGQHRGTGGNFILRAWTPEISEILRDPDMKWPYHTVRIEAFAATQAVA